MHPFRTTSGGLIIPDEKLVAPSVAPIEYGSRLPNIEAFPNRIGSNWGLWTLQRRSILRQRRVASTGEPVSVIVGPPGTAKTSSILLFFWEGLAIGMYRFVLFVVPTEYLAGQVIEATKKYLGSSFQLFLGSNSRFDLNPENPWHIGCVITYAMLGQPGAVERWTERMRRASLLAGKTGRTGGVLCAYDECHHLADTARQFSEIDDSDPELRKGLRKGDFRPWGQVATGLHHGLVLETDRSRLPFPGHSILATATPNRHDQARMPITDYCPQEIHAPETRIECGGTVAIRRGDNAGSLVGVGEDLMVPHVHVECTYKEGYEDGALKPLVSVEMPASVKFRLGREGSEGEHDESDVIRHETDELDINERDLRRSLNVAVKAPGINVAQCADAEELIVLGKQSDYVVDGTGYLVEHWRQHRRETIPDWAMLTVSDGQVAAAKLAVLLIKRFGVRATLAISGSGSEGKRAIKIWEEGTQTPFPDGNRVMREFREGQYEALCTAAMANEGYDVPRVSHIGIYTPSRSESVIIQISGRGGRTYQKYKGKQANFVFHPGDRIIVEILRRISSGCGGIVHGVEAILLGESDDQEGVSDGGADCGDDGTDCGGGDSDRNRKPLKIIPIQANLIRPENRAVVVATQPATISDDQRMSRDLVLWMSQSRIVATAVRKHCSDPSRLKGRRLSNLWHMAKRMRGE